VVSFLGPDGEEAETLEPPEGPACTCGQAVLITVSVARLALAIAIATERNSPQIGTIKLFSIGPWKRQRWW
jgi:hypothetical protein